MTYLSTTQRRYPQPRPRRASPRPLSDWFDDMIQNLQNATGIGSQESQCLATANAAVAPFDARITALAQNWNPTGFYTASDVRNLISSTMTVVTQAQSSVDQAAKEPNASQDSVMRATDDLARAGSRSLDYLQAARDADAQGVRVINAPGLKRWVTDTLSAASSAVVTASVIGCITPWWVGALATFQAVFDAAENAIKGIVGTVIAIGETALKVAADLPDIVDVLKWAALAGAAYWLWTKYNNRKGAGTT